MATVEAEPETSAEATAEATVEAMPAQPVFSLVMGDSTIPFEPDKTLTADLTPVDGVYTLTVVWSPDSLVLRSILCLEGDAEITAESVLSEDGKSWTVSSAMLAPAHGYILRVTWLDENGEEKIADLSFSITAKV